MPVLSKKRHEDFCFAQANRPCAGDPAHVARFEFANRYQAGYRLLRRRDVVAHIAELQEEIAERERQTTAVPAPTAKSMPRSRPSIAKPMPTQRPKYAEKMRRECL